MFRLASSCVVMLLALILVFPSAVAAQSMPPTESWAYQKRSSGAVIMVFKLDWDTDSKAKRQVRSTYQSVGDAFMQNPKLLRNRDFSKTLDGCNILEGKDKAFETLKKSYVFSCNIDHYQVIVLAVGTSRDEAEFVMLSMFENKSPKVPKSYKLAEHKKP